ncbi:MAG: DUF2281 domain-containing protein [Oscillospiraceae bacterium]|nr:DUF2281 domain-containing protein [Oscillospiraceae bacterium]
MASIDTIIKEIETLPPSIIEEVYDFIIYLKYKMTRCKINEITQVSEYVLSKEWLLPEEDSAWENL